MTKAELGSVGSVSVVCPLSGAEAGGVTAGVGLEPLTNTTCQFH